MPLPENIRYLLDKHTDVVAPMMPTLLDHIAWVTIWPLRPSPNHRTKYRVWRFEMSRRIYTYYVHGGDIQADETATLKEMLPAYTEEEVEAILLSWNVDFKTLRSGMSSEHPRP